MEALDAMTCDNFMKNFYKPLISNAEDPISNIRYRFVSLVLPKLYRKFGLNDTKMGLNLIHKLNKLKEDKDADV